MGTIKRIDTARCVVNLSRDFRMTPAEQPSGPPLRIDGYTIGFVQMSRPAPHNGELHPDGDELLYVISGKIRVTVESAPDETCELGAGECCLVPKGEWHQVMPLEPTHLIHITPGPHGDHRPLEKSK